MSPNIFFPSKVFCAYETKFMTIFKYVFHLSLLKKLFVAGVTNFKIIDIF